MVRSIQEMNDTYDDIDDLIVEMTQASRVVRETLVQLVLLKERGVKYLDADGQPVVPDNVLMFPNQRTLQ